MRQIYLNLHRGPAPFATPPLFIHPPLANCVNPHVNSPSEGITSTHSQILLPSYRGIEARFHVICCCWSPIETRYPICTLASTLLFILISHQSQLLFPSRPARHGRVAWDSTVPLKSTQGMENVFSLGNAVFRCKWYTSWYRIIGKSNGGWRWRVKGSLMYFITSQIMSTQLLVMRTQLYHK